MKSQATNEPLQVRIKNITDNVATIRLTKNVEPYETEDSSGYIYDEVEIKLNNRVNLEAYIEKNFDALYAKGEKAELMPKVKQAHKLLDSTDWIFAKCYELGLDPLTEYAEIITQRGEARELIRSV